MKTIFAFCCICVCVGSALWGTVSLGSDQLFTAQGLCLIQGKRIGLVTNQTGVTSTLRSTVELFEKKHAEKFCTLQAIFTPEHGLYGAEQANEKIGHAVTASGVPIYSLYGQYRRPTKAMLQGIDILVYDIQDIGSRPYTYATTLFYLIEEAAKYNIAVFVLDRPNPLGGLYVEGPMVEDTCRSFLGYVNVPYCHGMTIGELARFFNGEYHIGCKLTVIPMKGWQRWMRYEQTGLQWLPTSPNVPEPTTPAFFPATGMLGELQLVSIGAGCSQPFKVVTAPWIKNKEFAARLNQGGLKGVYFHPIRVKSTSGLYKNGLCEGVLIMITDKTAFNPVHVQFLLLDAIKALYPKKLCDILQNDNTTTHLFDIVAGSSEVRAILRRDSAPFAALCRHHAEKRKKFMVTRSKYLIPAYSQPPSQ